MSEIQVINNVSVGIKEWNSQRVVTFKDIDAVHDRPDGTARKRFNDNRERFIDGEDFYKVKCSEVRPFFGQTPPNGFNPDADLTLVTESGYLMLVKSFTDDLAWKVQRELVNGYFRARPQPKTTAEQLLAQAALMVEQEQRLAALEKRADGVAEAFETLALPSVSKDEWQEQTNKAVRKLCTQYKLSYQQTTGDMYAELESLAGVNLAVRQKNMRERKKRGGAKYAECQAVTKLSVVADDNKLREIYTGIVRRKAARLETASLTV